MSATAHSRWDRGWCSYLLWHHWVHADYRFTCRYSITAHALAWCVENGKVDAARCRRKKTLENNRAVSRNVEVRNDEKIFASTNRQIMIWLPFSNWMRSITHLHALHNSFQLAGVRLFAMRKLIDRYDKISGCQFQRNVKCSTAQRCSGGCWMPSCADGTNKIIRLPIKSQHSPSNV